MLTLAFCVMYALQAFPHAHGDVEVPEHLEAVPHHHGGHHTHDGDHSHHDHDGDAPQGRSHHHHTLTWHLDLHSARLASDGPDSTDPSDVPAIGDARRPTNRPRPSAWFAHGEPYYGEIPATSLVARAPPAA